MNRNAREIPFWSFPLCPEPPHWHVDWPGLVERIPRLGQLAGCPQDPVWHAEGDVFVHTRLVCEAIASLDGWRRLGAAERSIVFAAALLHDIAKPECTRDEEGRITSRGHALAGSRVARSVLWDALPDRSDAAALINREAVVGLVRHHGLPLTWSDKADPPRAVVTASMTARCDWLALVAEADVLGRTCADQTRLLDQVALFRELSGELNCADHPRLFPSDHSRFTYFRCPGTLLDREVYDDSRTEVLVMSGLPGAGKDMWLRAHATDLSVISLDALREELDVDPAANQGILVQAARERARDLLRRHEPFAWNATNSTRPMRDQLIGLFADYGARVRIVFVDASPAELALRNARRTDGVPQAVLSRLVARLDVPDATEAHRIEWVPGAGGVGTGLES